MPINASPFYQRAEEDYAKARTTEERLSALKLMYQTAPKHKGSEVLLSGIRSKIAKLKQEIQKEKAAKKTSASLSVKKEGAATICIVGPTNSGKSTLLSQITNAKPAIAPYEFTTKLPETGILDYHGVKIQVVEIPAIVKNFKETSLGPTLLSIIRQSDLIIITFNLPEEKNLLDKELHDIKIPQLIYNQQENIKDEIWKRLNLIKVRTKQPGKKPDFPPIALEKGSTVKDIAEHVHKDFLKQFKYAKIWGKSAKFTGQSVGLTHKLKDDDVVELHLK